MGIFTRNDFAATPVVAETQPLVELAPGLNLAQFFAENTGRTPDPNYFGVYAVEGVGGSLYLGLGTARPAESDGALLARFNGKELKAVSRLDEQGFVSMRSDKNTLYIPGADPTEDWTLGNAYTDTDPGPDRDAPAVEKHRNMKNVLHTWGIYPQPDTKRVYAAVGQHAGDNMTYYGGVFISDDDCKSWTAVDDPRHVLGDYRTYDICEFAGRLYAIVNDQYERPSQLAVSLDGGTTWKRVAGKIESRPRLCATGSYLAALAAGRDGLQLVSAAGKVTQARFRSFLAADWAYNYLCAGYGGWYYMLGDGGRIYNSRDLKTWTLVADTGLALLGIGFWRARNWLIVTDRGAGASVYRLDLALYGAV